MEQGFAFFEKRKERVLEDETVSGVPVNWVVSVMRKGTSSTLRMRIQRAIEFGYQWIKTLCLAHIRYVHRPLIVVGEFRREKNVVLSLRENL